jgi:hypothetical protein
MNRHQIYRKGKIEKGLCEVCLEPSMPGILTCRKHRDYYRAKNMRVNAKYVKKYKESGRCVRCSAPLDPDADMGFDCCINCRGWRNETNRV